MHCFTAKTACAVLDVLGPPYCDPEGRHCQYYFDYPLTDFPGIAPFVTVDRFFSLAFHNFACSFVYISTSKGTHRNVVQIKQTKFRFVYFLFGYLFSFKIARLILDVSATLCSCVVITFTERTSWEVFIVVDYGKERHYNFQ